MNNDYLKNIKQALADIESNRNSLINEQKQIDEVQEAKKLAQSRYRNGTGTNLELTNARTNVQDECKHGRSCICFYIRYHDHLFFARDDCPV